MQLTLSFSLATRTCTQAMKAHARIFSVLTAFLVAISVFSIVPAESDAAIKGVTKAPKSGKTIKQSNTQKKHQSATSRTLSQTEIRLEKLESTLFLETYPKDKVSDRLDRIETDVFSKTETGKTDDERLSNLEKLVVLPIKPALLPENQADNQGNIDAASAQSNISNASQQGSSYEPALDNTINQNNSYQKQPAPAMSATQRLDELEKYLFNKTYPQDTVLVRVNRLEAQVNQNVKTASKGTGKHGTIISKAPASIDARLKALSKTVLGQENPPLATQNPSQQPNNQPGYNNNDVSESNPGYDRYGNPYNQQSTTPEYNNAPTQPGYQSRNLYLPPEAAYGQPPLNPGNNPSYNNASYNNQPNGYQPNSNQPASYPSQANSNQGMSYSDPDGGENATTPASHSAPSAATQADMNVALGNLEKELFKASYAQEPIDSRLSRLETRVFKQTSPDMPEEDRLERLIAVVAADGDNPKSIGRGGSWQALLPFLIMIPLMLL